MSTAADARPAVVLVGPPGAGKTTVGRLLADRLGTTFLDTDLEIERVTGASVPELFATRGEDGFRAVEHDVVTRVLTTHAGVLGLGGGAVVHAGTRAALAGHTVVHLDVDAATAADRVVRSGVRPLLADDPEARLTALLAERGAYYAGVATHRVPTAGRAPEDIVAAVLALLRGEPTRITVSGAAPYDVVVGAGLDGEIGNLLGDAARVVVLHPAALGERARRLAASLSTPQRTALTHELPDGEAAKTVDIVTAGWALLEEHRFSRTDAVVALGGGATTDVAGFIAATWLRGIRLVNVPTTLLAMVDAAVGGKTGINTAGGKNLVGAFYPPAGVVCDLQALTTLPVEELRAGLAEVVKCGFIAEPEILELLEGDGARAALDPASPVLRRLVELAVGVKARVVGEDLREAGLRELLNYGHTFGHAVERLEDYGWRHGEAVAVGMVFAAELARALGFADDALVARHREVLTRLGLPTTYAPGRWEELVTIMRLDKKVRGDQLRFVLLRALGDHVVVAGPEPDALDAAYRAVTGAGVAA